MAKSLRLEAAVDSLQPATEFVRLGAMAAGWSVDRLGEVDLIVEELFMNVARYAYPEGVKGLVEIHWWVPRTGVLAVELADQGAPFDPLSKEAPDLTLPLEERPIGGLGLFLVRRMTSALEYRREGDWNRLRFEMT
jgi:serine/threonine-protein kinase RsbW